MTQLVLSVLPLAVAVVGSVFAVCCTAALAVDLFLHFPDKKAARPCEGRRRDPRGGTS